MAWDLNKVILVGRLVRDPELSYTSSQVPVCRFSIANNRTQDEVHFFEIITWNKVAASCHEHLKKGSQVVVDARLKQSRYQDKTGASKSRIEIHADQVQFLGAKSQTDASKNDATGPELLSRLFEDESMTH